MITLPYKLQYMSFEANKSTKGASKLRRDLINAEIANLRDLLPLPSSTRQRLSQLQLMALVCVYVRKANYFQHGTYQTVFCEEAEGRRKPRNERAFGQHGVIIGSLARHLPFAAQNSRGHLAARPETDSRRRAVLKWRRPPDTDLDTAMHAGSQYTEAGCSFAGEQN
ncbi:unnamed protein product [Ixodes pacificus]